MARGRVVAAAIGLCAAGCFDFDLLKRPPHDLGSADLSQPDLASTCLPAPTLPGQVFYVAPGGSGDGSKPNSAAPTIQPLVTKAQQSSKPTAILIASGTYQESVSVTAGTISIYGGWDAGFNCRSPEWPPSTKIIGPAAAPAVSATGGTVRLETLTLTSEATGIGK